MLVINYSLSKNNDNINENILSTFEKTKENLILLNKIVKYFKKFYTKLEGIIPNYSGMRVMLSMRYH